MTTYDDEPMGSSHKSFKDKTPDEVERDVENMVRRGVAGVAGAAKGFSEEVEKNRGTASDAIKEAGKTTREIGGTAKEEATKTRDTMKSS